jgi:hypothetical protein
VQHRALRARLTDAHTALCNGDAERAEGVRVWLASRDRRQLQAEGTAVSVKLDGALVTLTLGEHFVMSASDLK